MIRHYYVTYTRALDLKDVYRNLSKRIIRRTDYIDSIQFLNEQGANYTIHMCLHMGRLSHTRIYVSVEEDYMNMFYLKTNEIVQTISDDQMVKELAVK